jgi:hypothetical protein
MGKRTQEQMRKLFSAVLIALTFLTASVQAQTTGLQKVRIDVFDGGENSYDLADIINPNQGTVIENAVISRKGQISKRRGQALFAPDVSDTAFTGLGTFYPDINTGYLLAASGQRVVRTDTTGTAWTVINPSNTLTTGKDTEFIQANNLLFILNGQDATANYDGSTYDPGALSAASPAVATTGAWLRNYLFLAGNPSYSDWVYFSNNLAPKTFTASDIIKINTGDGQKIMRLEPFKLNELIIYKQRSIFVLDISGSTPLSDWTVQPVTKSIGCAAGRSVVNIGNDQWFLSSEPFAVRSLARSSFDKLLVDMMSGPVQDIFDGTGAKVINKTQVSKSCAVLFDNKYILAIPTDASTVNDYVLVYDFITKSWSHITGWNPAAWVVFNNNLYYIDANDGRVVQCFTGTIGDVTSGAGLTSASEPVVGISMVYTSKNINFDNPENYKALDSIDVEFSSSGSYTATLYIELDNGGFQNIGTINLAGDAPTLPQTLPFTLSTDGLVKQTFQVQRFGQFKKIKFKVVQDGLSEECKLHSFTIFATPQAWRRE